MRRMVPLPRSAGEEHTAAMAKALPPVIIIHSLAHAVAVLSAAAEVRRPVVLLSAPDAGISAGPGWWREVIAAARAAVPAA